MNIFPIKNNSDYQAALIEIDHLKGLDLMVYFGTIEKLHQGLNIPLESLNNG